MYQVTFMGSLMDRWCCLSSNELAEDNTMGFKQVDFEVEPVYDELNEELGLDVINENMPNVHRRQGPALHEEIEQEQDQGPAYDQELSF